LRIPAGGEMPRSEIDGYTEFVKIYGAKGLAYIKVNEAPGDATACRADRQEPARRRARRGPGAHRRGGWRRDLLRRDRAKVVYDSLGALRTKIGHSEFGRAHGCRPRAGSRCG